MQVLWGQRFFRLVSCRRVQEAVTGQQDRQVTFRPFKSPFWRDIVRWHAVILSPAYRWGGRETDTAFALQMALPWRGSDGNSPVF